MRPSDRNGKVSLSRLPQLKLQQISVRLSVCLYVCMSVCLFLCVSLVLWLVSVAREQRCSSFVRYARGAVPS